MLVDTELVVIDPFDYNGSAFAMVELDLDELEPIDYDGCSIVPIVPDQVGLERFDYKGRGCFQVDPELVDLGQVAMWDLQLCWKTLNWWYLIHLTIKDKILRLLNFTWMN